MKLAKRFMAAVLTALMALSLVGTALAAQEGELTGGSITINDAVPGQKYSAYQILYLESYSTDSNGAATGAYAYKANSAWADWLKTQTAYVAIDNQGYVTWVENADVKAFAALAQAHAANLAADASAVAPAAAEGATYSTVKFENLKLGYYLIDTTLGTLCSLDTTNPDVVMEEKNETTEVDKQVQEDSQVGTINEWGSSNDADISQTVNYKTVIDVRAGAENYILHDVMSEGLTFDQNSVKVMVGDTVLTAGTEYTLVVPDPAATDGDGCTFEIVFSNDYIETLTVGTEIVVTYSATLNEKAVVGPEGNTNKTNLQYGDENHFTFTPEIETITYTWDMGVLKYANGDETKVLADAQFVLLNSTRTMVATFANGKLTGWVEPPAGDNWPAACVLTTDANGQIAIAGLDADVYYLYETKAPAGYNKLATDVRVQITGATQDAESTTLTYTTVVAKVNNQSGAELPSTGGIGTTIFYIVGSVLVLGAIVLLVTKMRMGAKK